MPLTAAGKILAGTILKSRLAMGLTQDEFGLRYSVSGPAIFKFEKGFVRPSLKLWLRIARDAELTERRAVLMWLQSKIPPQYQQYVDLATSPTDLPRIKKGLIDYSSFETREAMQAAVPK
ncbi:MAG: helix-turn-helix transcriptional regulator, partial [Proteobacteria bacterium]|nr:helix-turn-helix transcriptional regulator [Pseudomonadota bacterium]